MAFPYLALVVGPRTGTEPFHAGSRELGFDLGSFWRWAASDLVSNVWRGVLAEYLVAQALGVVSSVRAEWDACDVRTPDGMRVEVKSAAYLQSWPQQKLSSIGFDIAMKRGWDPTTNTSAPSPCRSADVYVFALLAHQDKTTIDPLDLDQWRFYVVSARTIDEVFSAQKRIALTSLERVCPRYVDFDDLRETVLAAASTRGSRDVERVDNVEREIQP